MSPEIVGRSKMIYNAIYLIVLFGVITFVGSPDRVDGPEEYADWLVGLATANPTIAVIVILVGGVSGMAFILFASKSSQRRTHMGEGE